MTWPTSAASVGATPAATLWTVAAAPPGLRVTLVLPALSYCTEVWASAWARSAALSALFDVVSASRPTHRPHWTG